MWTTLGGRLCAQVAMDGTTLRLRSALEARGALGVYPSEVGSTSVPRTWVCPRRYGSTLCVATGVWSLSPGVQGVRPHWTGDDECPSTQIGTYPHS